jgi:hypothetical protein
LKARGKNQILLEKKALLCPVPKPSSYSMTCISFLKRKEKDVFRVVFTCLLVKKRFWYGQ